MSVHILVKEVESVNTIDTPHSNQVSGGNTVGQELQTQTRSVVIVGILSLRLSVRRILSEGESDDGRVSTLEETSVGGVSFGNEFNGTNNTNRVNEFLSAFR